MNEKTSIISQLFNKKQAKSLQNLFISDPSSHKVIYQSIATKLFDNEKIILGKGLDILSLILKNNSFGAADQEVFTVAIFIHKSLFFDNPLPYLVESNSLNFAIKTLTSLSFYMEAMEKRTERYGAPSPSYYRRTSQLVLKHHGYNEIAEKHQNWESFLIESFPS
jgi:hypothetical protein